jgi:hypothetical protein
MWASFYPAAAGRGPAFRAAMRAALAGRDVTTADLQHFFVTQARGGSLRASTACRLSRGPGACVCVAVSA